MPTVFEVGVDHFVEQRLGRLEKGGKELAAADKEHVLELMELVEQVVLFDNQLPNRLKKRNRVIQQRKGVCVPVP